MNNKENLRIWIRLNGSLFKARPSAERPLKWLDSEKINTESKPTWWLAAISRVNLTQIESIITDTELLDDFSSTTLY